MTQQFKNVSPLGALDIPALGRIVDADEVFDVTDDDAEYFQAQAENFERVVPAAKRARAKSPKESATPTTDDAPAQSTNDSAPTEGDETQTKEGDQ